MIPQKKISQILTSPIIKFIIPFIIWIIFFRKILLGHSPSFGDGFYHYVYVHYLVTNLRMGIFPLWNPFITLGMSQLFFNSFIGAFNPLWTVTLLLNLIGIKIYFAYVYSIIFYFFLGTIGFYLLAKIYFQENKYAYPAFILLLFSGFGFPMLQDLKYLITFVPMVWFFYFCFLFHKKQQPIAIIGATLTLMVGATSYFPSYWIIILAITVFLALVFFPRSLIIFVKKLLFFSKHHKATFLICLLCLFVSCILTIKTYTIARDNEIVFSHRKNVQSALSEAGPDVGLSKIKGISLTIEQFKDEFINLGPGRFSSPSVAPLYISPAVYIFILLGCLNQLTKAIAAKFLFCFILFLLIAVPNSPIIDFFFYHLWGFSLIQGTSSLLPALMMGMIFLAIAQGKKIVEEKIFSNAKLNFLFIALFHFIFVYYFITLSNFSFTIYASIGISLLFFFFVVFKNNQKIIIVLLLYASILLQPFKIMHRYARNLYPGSSEIFQAISHEPNRPSFSYHRPPLENSFLYLPNDHLWYSDILLRDAPAIDTRDFTPWWTYALIHSSQSPFLNLSLDPKSVEKYSLNKFYLYDYVYIADQTNIEFIDKIFNKQSAAAIVHLDPQKSSNHSLHLPKNILMSTIQEDFKQTDVIKESSEIFEVINFNANSLKIQTNFDRDRFLVYTDSYQSDWIAFIDGKKEEIFRSNIAFKGIFIPKGQRTVTLIYAPLGGQKIYLFALVLYNGLFLWLIVLSLNKKRKSYKNKLYPVSKVK